MPTPANENVTLVLGAARSGKSRYAEGLIARHAPPWIYVATAELRDDEMRARAAAHRARRGAEWITREIPIALTTALEAEKAPLLVDCLTLWLSNVMLGGANLDCAGADLIAALIRRNVPTVLVSNEVGWGIVPDNALARSFRDAAGLLHQRVAAIAGSVVLMVAGLPVVVK